MERRRKDGQNEGGEEKENSRALERTWKIKSAI